MTLIRPRLDRVWGTFVQGVDMFRFALALAMLASSCAGPGAEDKSGLTPHTDGAGDTVDTVETVDDTVPVTTTSETSDDSAGDTGPGIPPAREAWYGGFGGVSTDFLWDIAVDPSDGSLLVVGKFLGLANFGGADLEAFPALDPLMPTTDLFVAKYDVDGQHLWSNRYGGPEDDGSLDADIAVDALSHVYVGTNFEGTVDFGLGPVTSAGDADAVVMKLDPSGGIVWVQAFGGAGQDRIGGVGIDGSELWVAGSFSESVDPGPGVLVSAGGTDLFVAGWSDDGVPVAAHSFGGATEDIAWDLALGSSGTFWVAGTYTGTATFGAETFTSVGQTDTLVFEADRATGDVAWARTWGGLTLDLAYAVDEGPLGPVVAGYFKGTVDFGSGPVTTTGLDRSDVFVVALDPTGATRWNHTFGGDEHDQAMGVAVEPTTGEVVIGGYIAATVPVFWPDGTPATTVGSSDAFLIRYAAADGAQGTTNLYGCPETDTFRGVAIDGSDLYFGGHSSGPIVIDGETLDWHGGLDITLGRHPF